MKEWIIQNCFGKSGKIICHSTRIEWYQKRNYIEQYNRIYELTSFLPKDITLLERIYCIINDITERKKCLTCDNFTTFNKTIKRGYNNYCSSKCSQKDKNLQEIKKAKYKKTCFEKYGVDNTSKLNSSKEKIKNWYKNNYVQRKILSDKTLQSYYDMHINDKIPITILSKQLGFSSATLHNTLNRRGFKTKVFSGSFIETKLTEFIETLNVNFIAHDRKVLNGKELDIYLPDHNLAIEVNGLYWHCEKVKHKNHLLDKSNLCKELGIFLIHFYDVELMNNFKVVKSLIKSKLNLYDNTIEAKNTIIKEIDNNLCKEFLNDNHIQGHENSSINYGLFYQDKLVSVMTFNDDNDNDKWKLIRFCNLINTNVIDAESKLFKNFLNNMKPNSILSHSDLRYFNDNTFNKIGFMKINQSKPDYLYFHKKEYELHNKTKFKKRDTKNNDFLKIYNCGNNLYKYNNI